MWIDETLALPPLKMRAKVRRLQAEFDRVDPDTGRRGRRIGLVVVDGVLGGKESDRFSALKRIAKELQLPVVATSNLDVVPERGGRPQLSDLLADGIDPQHADNVCFLYRAGYYEADADRNLAEVVVVQQRSGPTGVVRLRWDGQCMRFNNPPEVEHDECLA